MHSLHDPSAWHLCVAEIQDPRVVPSPSSDDSTFLVHAHVPDSHMVYSESMLHTKSGDFPHWHLPRKQVSVLFVHFIFSQGAVIGSRYFMIYDVFKYEVVK